MKICKKIFLISAVIAGGLAFGQASSEDVEEISLPDVSTVISGGAPKVGKSAISDFSDVLPSTSAKVETSLPKLPESSEAGSLNSDAVVTVAPEKTIYVEGLAGGGYPGFITGNFKIYRQTGSSPFNVEFGHESASGYAGNALTEAFSDRDTFISADKYFNTKKSRLLLGGKYESKDNGLQNKVTNISNVTQETLGGTCDWALAFGKGFSLDIGAKGDWYKRYSSITGSSELVADYAKNVSVFEFNPEMRFGWSGNGFAAGIFADYQLESDLKDSFPDDKNVNRGNFGLDLSWTNEVVKIYADGSVVIGSRIGEDNTVVVPFKAGIDFGFNTGISSRKITMSISGGSDSSLPTVSGLENKYKFAALNVLPAEVSDWFGKVGVVLPIKDRFTLTMDGEVRSTAYGNGSILPDYDEKINLNTIFGQYNYKVEDLTQFNTNIDFAVRVGIANFSAGWRSIWADIPGNEAKNFINALVSVQDKNAKFGIDSGIGFYIDENKDSVPVVDFSAFYRLTSAVRLAVSTNDVVKLICGNERTYAGEYISRSGSAAVLVKFFF